MRLISQQQLSNTEFVRRVRNYVANLAQVENITEGMWRDWLSDQYRDLSTPITDEDGHEVFLDMDCFEGSDRLEEEVDSIHYWFRCFVKAVPPNVRPHVRREAMLRVIAIASILAARDPVGTAHWWDELEY